MDENIQRISEYRLDFDASNVVRADYIIGRPLTERAESISASCNLLGIIFLIDL